MSRWIYETDMDDTTRYVLGNRAKKMIACLGINPSTAKPGDPDNTLRSVERVTTFNGYDGFLVFNVYPQRATNPEKLHLKMDTDLNSKNVESIVKAVAKFEIHTLWLAYGNLIESREYFSFCFLSIVKALMPYNISWKTAGGITAKGHPRHPLYLPAKTGFVDFNLENYLKSRFNFPDTKRHP